MLYLGFFLSSAFSGSIEVNATLVKSADVTATVDMARATIALASQDEGMVIFGHTYYAREVQVGDTESKWLLVDNLGLSFKT